MLRRALTPVDRWRQERTLTPEAKAAIRRDRQGVPSADPGPERAIEVALEWIGRAQDRSRTSDGGVARHFGLVSGWAASYPETTGYIIPTLLDQARRRDRADLLDRARRMLDWLVSIQFPEGG